MIYYKFNKILEKISRAVVGIFSIVELQERIIDLCKDIFDAEACSLFLFNESGELHLVAARGYTSKFMGRPALFVKREHMVKNPVNYKDKLGITGWIASTGESFMSNSVEEHKDHPHYLGKYNIEQFGPNKSVHNFYGVPLKVADEGVIGVLKVEGKRINGKYQPFTEADSKIFDILAAHIAIAISDATKVEEIQRQGEQLRNITDALHKVILVLSEDKPIQNLFNVIINTTAEILSAEACVLFLKDEKRNILIERAGTGYVEQLIGKAEYPLISKNELVQHPEHKEDRVGLTAWIAITGKPFLARNNSELRAHEHWRGKFDDEHYPEGSGKKCNSFLGVPLLIAEEVVGVLKVENKIIDGRYVPFTDQDRQVFETLARSIAIAIGKIEEQRIKTEQSITDAMYRVSQALAGRFELEPLLEDIVEVGQEIFDAEACVVFLVDQNDPTILIETKGRGYVKHLEGKAKYHLIPKEKLIEQPLQKEDRVGLTAWIAIKGQSFLARNNEELRKHPHWRGRYDDEHYRPEGGGKKCESFLGLPLRVGDEVLGVLKVENKKIAGEYVPFDEREQHVFQILANSAAIAIQNARDFQKLREAQELAAIGTSAAAMAHRFGTPLQEIQSTIELLQENLKERKALTLENKEDINDIIKSVEQMSDAIKRIRKSSQTLEPNLDFHSIEEILNRSFTDNRSFSQQFHERRIKTSIEGLDKLKNPQFKCDRNLLEEAISNLVDNALQAIPNGSFIIIKVGDTHDKLCIEIQDDGPGINQAGLKNLFVPFRTAKKDGLGLGLFIVHRNIKAHGGTVNYEQPEKGACFRIELPKLQ